MRADYQRDLTEAEREAARLDLNRKRAPMTCVVARMLADRLDAEYITDPTARRILDDLHFVTERMADEGAEMPLDDARQLLVGIRSWKAN